MDYESERLDAYDASEAMRFVTGAVKREDPIEEDSKVTGMFDLDLINQQAKALADSLVDSGTKVVLGGVRDAAQSQALLRSGAKKVVLGGMRDAGQAALLGARDLVESRAERYVDLGLLDQPENPLELQVPTPRLPTVEEPVGFLGSLARDFVQFGTGYFLTPNKFGKFNPVIRSGIADAAYFDPEEGGFIRPLIEIGILPEAIEFLAVDDIDEETRAAQRLRERAKLAGEGALAGGTITAIIYALGAIKKSPKLMRYAAASLATALGATIPQPAEGSPFGTIAKTVAKQAGKTDKRAIRDLFDDAEPGLTPNPEKATNELRLHLNRQEAEKETGKPYPGSPKNERTVIKNSSNPDLPDVVVGKITPDDWQQRIEKAMTPEEINEAAKWYKRVFGEFQKQANGDPAEIARLTDAWFAGQQNSSPAQTLNDVLFVYEQIKRGVPKEELKGKGLPSANKIVIDILTESEITSGAGQKISDFIDSGYGKNVRSFMNNDPRGGSPFVVDVHTARDTGLVDQTFINHLTRLGYKVPKDLVIDFGGGGIKGPMYENRALFGLELTDHLNKQNWMGRSDWEPAEIQAIGWMQLSDMYGQANVGGDVVGAFATNTRRISMEVDPGKGSPWAAKFGDSYGALNETDKIAINNQVTARAIELVNRQQGIELGQVVHGTGGWEMFQNASTVQQAIASKQSAIEAGARLGLLLNQTEVWVNAIKPMTKNPKHFAVDILEDGSENLRSSETLRALFAAITEADTNGLFRGYQPVIIQDKPGIRIIIDDTAIKKSPLTKQKAQDYIISFANEQLGKIADDLDLDVEVDIMEADLTKLKNDWTKDKAGGSYKSNISGQPGEDAFADGSVFDTDRRELEDLFGKLIDEAAARSAGAAD